MTQYVLGRALLLLGGAVFASVVVFALMAVLPGDPAQVALGVGATPAAVAAQRHAYGLDRPIPQRYLDWVGGLLSGRPGESYVSHAAIWPQIGDGLGVTLWLIGGATVVALLVAIPVGTFAAVHHRNAFGLVLSGLSQVGVAVPGFLAGILLVYVFAVVAQAAPAGGYVALEQNPVQWWQHLLLPWLSLGAIQGAVLTRYVRSAVLDILHQDFIRTARSKGLRRTRALLRHGLRNASIPVLTVLGLQLANLLVGAVVVEQVFVLPGLGALLLSAVGNRDMVVVQDVVMLLVMAIMVLGFVTDLAYHALDPRLRDSR